ncbi:MAG: hypothetical protein GY928_28550 [Colwellia sp.]|nr:hypothetical protein [Colwellia sp.]
MNTYPTILRLENDTEVLAIKNKCGIALSYHKDDYEETFVNNYYEDFNGFDKAENITREYLANTKVEIESDEHSRFVQDIVISNGGKWGDGSKSIKFELSKFIVIDSNLKMTIKISSHSFANSENKLVKIPLPPKEPDTKEWPQVGDEVAIIGSDCKFNVISINNGRAWIERSYFDSSVVNTEAHEPLEIFESHIVFIDELKKPLTPEEELREKLKEELSLYISLHDPHDTKIDLTDAILNGEIEGLSYKPE